MPTDCCPRLLEVTGTVQKRDDVVQVIAETSSDPQPLLSAKPASGGSRDFHLWLRSPTCFPLERDFSAGLNETTLANRDQALEFGRTRVQAKVSL